MLSAASIAIWQLVAADLTFVGDDWNVLAFRSLSAQSLLTPYNEHLSAVPIAILVVLRDALGLGWHAAFLLPLLVAHVAAAAGIFSIARRRTRPVIAVAFAGLALFMGTGWDDLLWVFQVGAVVSVAAGVWALDLLDRPEPRPVLSGALIGIALASSSFAMPFAAAAGVFAILRRNRRAIASLAVVGATYGLWYVGYHSTGPGLCGPTSVGSVLVLAVPFALSSLVYAVGAPLGLGLSVQALMPIAAAIAVLWVLGLAWAYRERQRISLAIAALGGILVMGVLLAYSRSCLGLQVAGASRYVYVTGMLVLVGFAATRLGGLVRRLADRPPRATRVAALGLALALQVASVADGHAQLRASSDTVRAGVEVVLIDPSGSCHTSPAVVDTMTADIDLLPPPPALRHLVPDARMLAVPSWLPSATLDPTLVSRVRQVMCDNPPAGG